MRRKLRLTLILLLGIAVPVAMQIIGIPDRDHGGFLWAFAELLAVLPLCVILMNLLAGGDVKHFWATPLLLPAVFCAGHLMRGGPPNWIWPVGYLVLGIAVLAVTAARKRKRSEAEKST